MTTPEKTASQASTSLPEVADVTAGFEDKRGFNHFTERALSTIVQQAILSVPGVVQRSSGLEKITGRIAVSRAAAAGWRRALSGMSGPALPVAAIPNGIAVDAPPQPAAQPDDPAEGSAPRLLCVGRLTAQKRPTTLLLALARLRRDATPEATAMYLSQAPVFAPLTFAADRVTLFSARESKGGGPYVVEAAYPLG